MLSHLSKFPLTSLIFLVSPLCWDCRIWSTWSPRLKWKLHAGEGCCIGMPNSFFPDIFSCENGSTDVLLAAFPEGPGREDPIHSLVIPQDIAGRDQSGRLLFPMATFGRLILPFFSSLSDVLIIPFGQSVRSHIFPIDFFYYYFLYIFLIIVIFPKSSFHPCFSFSLVF